MNQWSAIEGTPAPLGATWIAAEQAYNFALYSRHATSVTILLYAEDNLQRPVHFVRLHHLVNKSGPIWHCRVPMAALRNAHYYTYIVEGPDDETAGHRFDNQKLLLDPYAKAVFFPPSFSRAAATGPGLNVGKALLGVIDVGGRAFDWGADARPRHSSDSIIYELHVRGFTQHASSGVRPEQRGTYAGVIAKIPYLQELGVTVVALSLLFKCDPQEGSYWGYIPLHFFSPHHAYASSPAPEDVFHEFRAMVRALHAAGIEVILDVVYNHTVEGDQYGPTYSFRGIDNSTYYLRAPDGHTYLNDSGTGNMLRCANSAVRKLLVDSMRWWVREMHIDGFRFDLASILTRNHDGSVNLED